MYQAGRLSPEEKQKITSYKNLFHRLYTDSPSSTTAKCLRLILHNTSKQLRAFTSKSILRGVILNPAIKCVVEEFYFLPSIPNSSKLLETLSKDTNIKSSTVLKPQKISVICYKLLYGDSWDSSLFQAPR